MTEYVHRYVQSPVGMLKLVASSRGLAAILWENDDPKRVRISSQDAPPDHAVLEQVERELGEYFGGQRDSFDSPLDFVGTDFQKAVWKALLEIPYGQTRTYQEIAHRIGRPSAVRAVGAANGRNPISILAPCHRVIGSDGTLTGFAGGLDAKRWLLAHEAGGAQAR